MLHGARPSIWSARARDIFEWTFNAVRARLRRASASQPSSLYNRGSDQSECVFGQFAFLLAARDADGAALRRGT